MLFFSPPASNFEYPILLLLVFAIISLIRKFLGKENTQIGHDNHIIVSKMEKQILMLNQCSDKQSAKGQSNRRETK